VEKEVLILTDPMTEPNNKIFEKVLGKKYITFENLISKMTEMGLVVEWKYYNDQKCWLGKILNKKKNICWLSIWNIGFKLTFYFTEKTLDGVFELEINEKIKKSATEQKPVGKLRPLLILIENNKVLNDSIKVLEYKRNLK
jgi:hypothetical protein